MTSSADLKEAGLGLTNQQKSVTWQVGPDGVAVIVFDVPGTKVNTLSTQSMTELNDAIDSISASATVKGLIITSGKTDNWIAGADVKEVQRLQSRAQIESYDATQLGKEVFAKLEKLPYPSVAVINGTCLGGGTELALACTYRLASKNTKIGLPEVKLGLIPGWGGCIRLPKLIGLQQALGAIMEGKILPAPKAWKVRMIDEIVDADKLMARAKEVAVGAKPKRASLSAQEFGMQLLLEKNPVGRSILRKEAYKAMMRATKGKYPAPKEALNVVLKSVELPAEKAFDLESRTFSRLAMTTVSKNLVGIFFAQNDSKKMPSGIGKRPDVKTIGVLGAGVMGAGIAQACAKSGYKVIVKDIEQKFLEKGKSTIQGLFDQLVQRKKLSKDESVKLVEAIVFTTDYSALSDCDLVIEAVLEDLDLKQKALGELDAVIKKSYVFATNTSSLSVDRIAEGTKDPGKVVGLHFFNPVHKMPLVEVVRGAKSTNEAIAAAMSVALTLDKTTVVTSDAPGFVVNRILAPYLREAAVLAEEGVPIQDIDKAMKSFGMPMGPMALLDEVGLDVSGKVIHVMHDALGERMSPPKLMGQIEALKLLGKKGGKGIYTYDEKLKPLDVNPDVQALITSAQNKKSQGEIQDRLVLLMLNEAARCLEEKVVEHPSQLDLALIFGTGFAPFTGGVLKYADDQGVAIVYEKLRYLAKIVGSRYEPCQLLQSMANNRSTFYRTEEVA